MFQNQSQTHSQASTQVSKLQNCRWRWRSVWTSLYWWNLCFSPTIFEHFFFAQQPFKRLGVVSSHPHFNPIELGQLNSSQIGQLDLLFHTYTYLVSRVGTLQNTDWLVSNIIFSPKVCKVRSDKLQLPAGAMWEGKCLGNQVKLFRSLIFFIFALWFFELREINAR